MPNKTNKELWVGSVSTLEVANLAQEKILAGFAGETPEASSRLTIVGGVGIVSIAGALVNRDSPYNIYAGVISYNEIRGALAEAVANPLIKHIVLDINSGGGAVSGINDASALIAKINDKVKPVTAYCGGAMASGGYWLGVAAGRIVVSPVAVVGSIGVITAHMDLTAAYAADGVKPTVIRAGKYKQTNSPLEALSETGLAEIQSQLDQVYGVFTQFVADRRSVSYNVADTQMAQGREFVGAQALTAGLVDSVSTFDELIQELVSKVALDTNKSFSNNNLNSFSKAKIMTMSLTTAQLAILEAGGALTEAEIATATALFATEAAAAALIEKTPEELAAEALAATAATEAAAAQVAAELEASKDKPTEIVAYLQTQLKAANDSNLELTIKLRGLEASSATALANEAALLAIAAGSVNKMNIALGGSERDLSALSAVAVLAEHATVSVDFNKKFKVGGVAVAASETDAVITTANVSSIHTARVNATKGK